MADEGVHEADEASSSAFEEVGFGGEVVAVYL